MEKRQIKKDYNTVKVLSTMTMLISVIVSLLSASIISGANTILSSSFIFLYGILILICLGFLGYVIIKIDEDNKITKFKRKVIKNQVSENVLYNIIIVLLSIEIIDRIVRLLSAIGGEYLLLIFFYDIVL